MTGQDKQSMPSENLPQAFARHQIVTGESGNPDDYIFLKVSAAFEEMAGLSRDIILGEKVTDVLPGFKKGGLDWSGIYSKMVPGGDCVSSEQYSEPLDRWYEITAYSDEPGYFTLIIRDVTGKKKSEYTTKKMEAQYKDLVDNARDLIQCVDSESKFIFVNQAWLSTLGYSAEEIVSLTLWDIIHPDSLEHCMTAFKQVLAGEALGEVEAVFAAKDGARIMVEGNVNVKLDENGQFVHTRGIFRDITERKQVEKKLENRETLQQLLIAMATELINIPLEKVDNAINKMLEKVGLFSGLDRVYIFSNDYDRGITTNTHEWCAEGIAPEIDNLKAVPLNQLADLLEPHQRGELFMVPRVADMPVNDNIRMIIEPQGIRSLLLVPLMHQGLNIGFVGFDAVREDKEFTKTEANLLRVFAELIVNIEERRKAEEKLHHQYQFENLISDIASQFVNISSKQTDESINHALKLAGEYFGVDRSYVFLFSPDGQTMSNTHEWCADGSEPQKNKIQDMPLDGFIWAAEQLRNKDYIIINDVNSLPAEAEFEKIIYQSQDIKSLIMIAIFGTGTVSGFLGFDSVLNNKLWAEEQVSLLRVLAELISNALSRAYAFEKIRFLSFHDQLTGLHNRHFLEEEMERLDTKRQLPISIIMVDLNGLKLINDTYGHGTGDEMLKLTAAILKETCRDDDLIARFGGDEFVIYLPRTPEKEALKISRRIDQDYRKEQIKDVPISLSSGVAVKINAEQKLFEVLKEAEDSMYQNKLTENRSGKSAVLNTLLKTLAAKSFETEAHTCNMQELAFKVGGKLGLSDSELHRLKLLITLHDIGKINIPGELLIKKGTFTAVEWETMRKHCETGYRIARATDEFAHVAEDILAHHERWDGSGYPQGLKEQEIPLLARITAIADAYEVMSNGRPYKKAMSKREIAAEYKRCSGTQFDPELVEIILSVMEADG